MRNQTVLILTAHADDCEFLAGGTVARFVSEGFDVVEVIAADNSRGSFELDSETLIAQSRDREAREAARILGKKEVSFLGYSDGFLADGSINELREEFIRSIRTHRPRVLMTWDPWAPFESHPDHRHVGMAAVEAAEFAGMPLFHPEQVREGLQPHVVPERYYFAKFPERADKVVDITPFMDKKIEALLAHDSQMKLTLDLARKAFETMDPDAEILEMLDRDNYGPVFSMLAKAVGRRVGEKIGCEYGEEFRYETVIEIFRLDRTNP